MLNCLYLFITAKHSHPCFCFRKIQDSLRPFAQFYNCREFDHIVRNLIKEKDLKFRIRELLKYRAAGITRVEECVEYEKTRVGPTKRLLGSIDEEDEEVKTKTRLLFCRCMCS